MQALAGGLLLDIPFFNLRTFFNLGFFVAPGNFLIFPALCPCGSNPAECFGAKTS